MNKKKNVFSRMNERTNFFTNERHSSTSLGNVTAAKCKISLLNFRNKNNKKLFWCRMLV